MKCYFVIDPGGTIYSVRVNPEMDIICKQQLSQQLLSLVGITSRIKDILIHLNHEKQYSFHHSVVFPSLLST